VVSVLFFVDRGSRDAMMYGVVFVMMSLVAMVMGGRGVVVSAREFRDIFRVIRLGRVIVIGVFVHVISVFVIMVFGWFMRAFMVNMMAFVVNRHWLMMLVMMRGLVMIRTVVLRSILIVMDVTVMVEMPVWMWTIKVMAIVPVMVIVRVMVIVKIFYVSQWNDLIENLILRFSRKIVRHIFTADEYYVGIGIRIGICVDSGNCVGN